MVKKLIFFIKVNFNPYVTVNEISQTNEPKSESNTVEYNIQLSLEENIKKLNSPPPSKNF
jgi:hypothetical protein